MAFAGLCWPLLAFAGLCWPTVACFVMISSIKNLAAYPEPVVAKFSLLFSFV
jgi:hypothetical protein